MVSRLTKDLERGKHLRQASGKRVLAARLPAHR
jgi:hypothetical protein